MRKNGKLLRRVRTKNGITTEEIAAACGISTTEYNHIEKGKVTPSDEMMEVIHDVFLEYEIDISRSIELEIKREKNIIRYILFGLSIMFISSFFMEFGYGYWPGGGGYDGPYIGLRYVFGAGMDYHLAYKMAFALYSMQLIYYIVWLITKRFTSNIFNIMTILFSVAGTTFVSIEGFHEQQMQSVVVLLISLTVLVIVVSLYDLIKYPLEHDFVVETYTTRKFIIYAYAIVLALLFTTVIEYMFDSRSDIDITEAIIFILWAVYIITVPFLKKSFYESRYKVNLFLLFPPVAFTLFYIIYTIKEGYPLDEDTLYMSIIMLLPVFGVNIDFLVSSIREQILHLRKNN